MVLTIVLVWLASYRLTRFLAVDEFPPLAAIRLRIERRWGDASWQSYLSECPHCVGVYATAGVVAVTLAAGIDVALPMWVWLAGAGAVSLLSSVDAVLSKTVAD